MKPLNWLYLYILFLTSLLLTFTLMYYNKQHTINSMNSKESTMMNHNWTW